MLHVATAAPIPPNAECRISLEPEGAAFQSQVIAPLPAGYSQREDGSARLLFSSGLSLDPTVDYAYLHAHHPEECGPDQGLIFDDEGQLIVREASITFPLPPPLLQSDFLESLAKSDKRKRTRRMIRVRVHITNPASDAGAEAPVRASLFERTLRLSSLLPLLSLQPEDRIGLAKCSEVEFPLFAPALGHRFLRWTLEELYRDYSIFARRACSRHVPAGRPASLTQQDFVKLLTDVAVIHSIFPRSRQGSGGSAAWWPPFSKMLIGPIPHPMLTAQDAASIFRAIMREPRSEQEVEREECAHDEHEKLRSDAVGPVSGSVAAVAHPAPLPPNEMDFAQFRRALQLVSMRLGQHLRIHGRASRRRCEVDDPLERLPPVPTVVEELWWKQGEVQPGKMAEDAEEDGADATRIWSPRGSRGALNAPPRLVGAGRRKHAPASSLPTLPHAPPLPDRKLMKPVSLFSMKEQDIAAIKAHFASRGGTLEIDDIQDVFRTHFGHEVSITSLRELFLRVDINTTGAVSWAEFANAVLDSSLSTLHASGRGAGSDGPAAAASSANPSLFEKGAITSFVPEKESNDALGGEVQPGIGSREDVLVGAVFVPEKDLICAATLCGNVETFKANGARTGQYHLPAIPLLPSTQPPTIPRATAASPRASPLVRAISRPASVDSSHSASLSCAASAPFTDSVAQDEGAGGSPPAGRTSADKFAPRSPKWDDSAVATFSQTSKFSLTSHVVCLCAVKYNKSPLVALGMTDGSVRFFDASINAQACQYQAAERGDSLISALAACCLTAALDGAGNVRANMIAIGFDNGTVQLLNADVIHKEVLQRSNRASAACEIIKKTVFGAVPRTAGGRTLSRTGSRTGSESGGASETQIQVQGAEKPSVSALIYVPQLHALLAGSMGGKVARIDLDGEHYEITSFRKHSKEVRAIAYVPAYKYICR